MLTRRDLIKISLCAGCYSLLPSFPERAFAASPLDSIVFDNNVYTANNAQTIMVFLYGGASELAGNLTNLAQFNPLSDTDYIEYFGAEDMAVTANGFWKAAGGDIMEELLTTNDLNIFRTCFSQVRWDADNRSHGSCVNQNQRGTFNEDAPGILANLARILYANGKIDENTKMPFVSMDGESGFFARGDLPMIPVLEPVAIDQNLDNPFSRPWDVEENYSTLMDTLAQARNNQTNLSSKITDAFTKRHELESFINDIKEIPDPTLGDNGSLNYDIHNSFAQKMKTAVKVLKFNPETKVVALSTAGLGGWDDHNDADNYLERMKNLFKVLRTAVAHIQDDSTTNMINSINIMIMGDFGRGANLNSANGWDHGNLQTFYNLGGKGYFSTPGVVGETELDNSGNANRLFLRPKAGSPWFEPNSIAATLYSIYGVTNPEILTDNNSVIQELFA